MSSSTTSTSPFSIAVVGGGIAGVTLTIALLNRGLSVRLYERGANFEEVGAGIGVSINAALAIDTYLMSGRVVLLSHSNLQQGIKEAFDRVATSTAIEGKDTVWFDWVDGYSKNEDPHDMTEKSMFTLHRASGAADCHRAHFLDGCIKLLPDGVTCFRKHLNTVIDKGERGLLLEFQDGSSATADAVIGCDGIRSRVRQLILGEDGPQYEAQYSHAYGYRGLIPMVKAVKELGENFRGRFMHMGPNAHMLTYPVAGGKIMNVVAFVHDPSPWPHKRLDVPATPSKVLADFADFGPALVKITELLIQDPGLNCWGIHDLGDRPLPTYAQGRICIIGDAAHASSPHFGAGAGFGIEDSAIMAEILAEAAQQVVATSSAADGAAEVTPARALAAAFQAFDTSRRERTQWLVKHSRDAIAIYEWRYPASGRDPDKCREELDWRTKWIWDADIPGMASDARRDLARRLAKVHPVVGKS